MKITHLSLIAAISTGLAVSAQPMMAQKPRSSSSRHVQQNGQNQREHERSGANGDMRERERSSANGAEERERIVNTGNGTERERERVKPNGTVQEQRQQKQTNAAGQKQTRSQQRTKQPQP